jgi:hypothetical protein
MRSGQDRLCIGVHATGTVKLSVLSEMLGKFYRQQQYDWLRNEPRSCNEVVAYKELNLKRDLLSLLQSPRHIFSSF